MVPVQGAVPPPAAASTFNPMKILIPAAVAVLVVFGLFFVFNRNTPATDANTNQTPPPTLAADPNSQPVQVASPATGRSEEGLPSGGTINPSANVNASPNANTAVSPVAIEDVTPTAAAYSSANASAAGQGRWGRRARVLAGPAREVLNILPSHAA